MWSKHVGQERYKKEQGGTVINPIVPSLTVNKLDSNLYFLTIFVSFFVYIISFSHGIFLRLTSFVVSCFEVRLKRTIKS